MTSVLLALAIASLPLAASEWFWTWPGGGTPKGEICTFQSIHLLDERAILACMVYVDLNPIRAAIAERPETNAFIRIQERIHLRHTARVRAHLAASSLPASHAPTLTRCERERQRAADEHGSRLAPIASLVTGLEQASLLTRDDYLTLVDDTGRPVRSGKRGAIPAHLAPIHDRLHLDLDAWMGLMRHAGSFLGGAFGHLAARAREALRRRAKWIVDITRGLYREPESTS